MGQERSGDCGLFMEFAQGRGKQIITFALGEFNLATDAGDQIGEELFGWAAAQQKHLCVGWVA